MYVCEPNLKTELDGFIKRDKRKIHPVVFLREMSAVGRSNAKPPQEDKEDNTAVGGWRGWRCDFGFSIRQTDMEGAREGKEHQSGVSRDMILFILLCR